MFAIVQTGGKQYKVSVGDTLKVEKLELEVGSKVNFDVLLTSDNGKIVAGNPVLKNVTCTAEVVAQGKGDKIVVYKYKPKKNYRRKQGHRQPFTQVKILEIK
ncbi:MAG: 50S ribosomal protein L21 [Clostridiales bacterium]|nr:50S ribosomal protein L21 [Clostridiales bacterium]